MARIFFTILLLQFFTTTTGQTDSTKTISSPKLDITAYLDIFYAYDINKPTTSNRLPFLYNHNRHNNFNLNLGIISAKIQHNKYRVNLSLQAGTYTTDNYANEPGGLQNVYEANIGVALNKQKNLWADVGIMTSHLGFESAVSKDQWTLTRSLLAENSPYYLSGAKLTYTHKNNWEFAALLCNGWQRITGVRGNSIPSAGTQIKYVLNNKYTFNWSTFYGTDYPDSIRKMRLYNNFYIKMQPSKRWGIIAGFDIGSEQKEKGSKNYNVWYSPVIIVRYAISESWFCAVRGELFNDEKNVLISINNKPFFTRGISFNLDCNIDKNLLWRMEARYLNSTERIFQKNTAAVKDNLAFLCGLSAQL